MAIAIAALAAAAMPALGAEEPTRESYVAAVNPICERNVELSKQILDGAQERINDDELRPAGSQFTHVSTTFGEAIRKIVAIPRPPADDARLLKWFRFLRIVKKRLGNIGKQLKEGERIKASHESIRAEQSGNAANNVSFVFGFSSCRLTRSQFR